MSIIPYKNLAQIPNTTPSGAGGLAVFTTSKQLADRFGQIIDGGYNAKDYNSAGLVTLAGGGASGSATTTTGNISSGFPTLTVASAADFVIGQGILVKGAGAAGAHLVTTISNIVGTTFTLAANAGTNVSGAVVQHDDTAAINAALAAAMNAGGGMVTVPNGYYRTNGAFNGTTNSILTLPQVLDTAGLMTQIGIIGQARGSTNGTNSDTYVGGVMFDCKDAPTASGTFPCWFATAPYVSNLVSYNPSSWSHTCCYFDNITVVFPASSPFGGLRLANSMQAIIGDGVSMFAAIVAGVPTQPPSGTVGLYMPQFNNNVKLRCGSAQFLGFDIGIMAGEHMVFDGPYLNFNNVGIGFQASAHIISGHVNIESCPLMMQRDSTGTLCTIDMTLTAERAPNGTWWQGASTWGLVDNSNFMRGNLRYIVFDHQTGATGAALSVSGANNLHFQNLFS